MGLLGWRGHFPVSESMETVQRDGLRAECARPRRVSVLCRPRKEEEGRKEMSKFIRKMVM